MTRNLALLFLVVFVTMMVAWASVSRGSTSRGAFASRNVNYHRLLHEALAIGDDPTEDIRTNILLNMEGL